MPELLTAFSTGLLATISRCVLLLYPGFLTYLSGHGRDARQPANTLLLGVLTMIALGALIATLQVSVPDRDWPVWVLGKP
nr:hypothetical protein [Ardenticatena sp.]